MFGLIVSGRLVQTDFSQVGETQFVVTLPEADSIKHIVIFLTGVQPFPDGFGGAVYFSWPDENTSLSWHLLGNISNEKPSAIFKISGLKTDASSFSQGLFLKQQSVAHHAQVGISVEPLQQIIGLTPVTNSEPSSLPSFVEFSKFVCENVYNYASGFAQTPNQIVPVPNENYLPLSILTRWYEYFTRKLEQNPNFWKK
ncbi:Protein Hikeshi [Armadillidium nasatum]|uniref:Protein Hikeshi n=1 Tax=Armadillidium nasatum TaxID=96803 RepID=A0A5N5T7U4_9CRUS|nr:Protein Hikeshi [Armadillidium nasatum]